MPDNSAALQKIIDDPDSNPSDVVKAVEILNNMAPDSAKQTGTTAQNTSADARQQQAANGADRNNITLWDAQMMADLKAQVADTLNQYHNREIDATELNNQLQHIDKQAEQAVTARGQNLTAMTSLANNATSKGAMTRGAFEQLWNRGNAASGGKWGAPPAPLSQDDIMQHVAAMMPNNAVAKNILASTGAGTTPDTNPGMAKVQAHQQAIQQAAGQARVEAAGGAMRHPTQAVSTPAAPAAPAQPDANAYMAANPGNGFQVAASGVENAPPAGPTVAATPAGPAAYPDESARGGFAAPAPATPGGFTPASAVQPTIDPMSGASGNPLGSALGAFMATPGMQATLNPQQTNVNPFDPSAPGGIDMSGAGNVVSNAGQSIWDVLQAMAAKRGDTSYQTDPNIQGQ